LTDDNTNDTKLLAANKFLIIVLCKKGIYTNNINFTKKIVPEKVYGRACTYHLSINKIKLAFLCERLNIFFIDKISKSYNERKFSDFIAQKLQTNVKFSKFEKLYNSPGNG